MVITLALVDCQYMPVGEYGAGALAASDKSKCFKVASVGKFKEVYKQFQNTRGSQTSQDHQSAVSVYICSLRCTGLHC